MAVCRAKGPMSRQADNVQTEWKEIDGQPIKTFMTVQPVTAADRLGEQWLSAEAKS